MGGFYNKISNVLLKRASMERVGIQEWRTCTYMKSIICLGSFFLQITAALLLSLHTDHQVTCRILFMSSGSEHKISSSRWFNCRLVTSLIGISRFSHLLSLFLIFNTMSTTSTSGFPCTHNFMSYK